MRPTWPDPNPSPFNLPPTGADPGSDTSQERTRETPAWPRRMGRLLPHPPAAPSTQASHHRAHASCWLPHAQCPVLWLLRLGGKTVDLLTAAWKWLSNDWRNRITHHFQPYDLTTMSSPLCPHHYALTTLLSLLCPHYYALTTTPSPLRPHHAPPSPRCKYHRNISSKSLRFYF